MDLREQSVTEEGHAVIVAARVLNIVDVTPAEPAAWVVDAPSAAVTRQTVVVTTKVSVVTWPGPSLDKQ